MAHENYRFRARHRWHNCKYCLHWMYMNTTPPVRPTVTTTNFVQNGHPIMPRFTSSAARSISTHSDHITHNAAAQWNKTAQNKRLRSTPDMSKLRHCNKNRNEFDLAYLLLVWRHLLHLPHWMALFLYALWTETCTIHRNLFRMRSAIVVSMFDAHTSNYPNSSRASTVDSVDHFHNDKCGKYHRCFVMLDYYSIQICEEKVKIL